MAEKQKILITDDSPLNRALLMDILGEEYDYLEAENGLIALDYLRRRGDLDLMLLDINMPELDGFGVLEQMKRFQWSDALPVIIISAEQTSSFMDHAYDLGVSDYIARPFDASVVRHRVQNTLMLHACQRQLVHILEQQVYYRERTNGTMINILSHAIESRNNESGLHTLRVRIITNLLLHHLVKTTDRYPLSEADISAIATASALHDLGKMSVPRSILNKPGKLTPEEFEIMKHHTIAGDELIATAPGPDSDPLLARHPGHLPLAPRALERQGLPRRSCGGRDPHRRPGGGRGRRVRRPDQRTVLQKSL